MPPTDDRADPYVPKILGVLNLSPESMVSESIAIGPAAVAERAGMLARTGADWVDVGGRSITPDAPLVSDDVEQTRLAEGLALMRATDATPAPPRLSVDTWSPATARFALERGADGINYTGGPLPSDVLDAIAAKGAALFLTFMPYENAYAMRTAAPEPTGLQAVLDHLGPKVEAARRAGVPEIVVDPNLGIIHPTTDDHAKIHGPARDPLPARRPARPRLSDPALRGAQARATRAHHDGLGLPARPGRLHPHPYARDDLAAARRGDAMNPTSANTNEPRGRPFRDPAGSARASEPPRDEGPRGEHRPSAR